MSCRLTNLKHSALVNVECRTEIYGRLRLGAWDGWNCPNNDHERSGSELSQDTIDCIGLALWSAGLHGRFGVGFHFLHCRRIIEGWQAGGLAGGRTFFWVYKHIDGIQRVTRPLRCLPY
jgi:hypothetical protein